MSTPVDPQRSTPGSRSSVEPTAASAAGNVAADHGDAPSTAAAGDLGAASTTRWSDAQVMDGAQEHHGTLRRHTGDGDPLHADTLHADTTQLPAIHADAADRSGGERRPQVDVRDSVAGPVGAATERLHGEQDRADTVRELSSDRYRDGADDGEQRALPTVVGAPDRQTVVAREKERFGGMKFGSAFFGWLTATGLAVLLLAILAAAGVAFGVATDNNVNTAVQQSQNATGTARTVGLIGAIVLLVILFVAYYCGGYVAGRMARFDGVKQGLGVWIWAIITSAVIAAVAAIAGAKYNVLAQLNLPRIPVDEGSVTTVGIIAIVAAVVVALLGALLGGAVGTRYHRKVDAVGFDEARR